MTSIEEINKMAIGLPAFICIRKFRLPEFINKKECIVMNLGDHGFGTHWVAVHTPSKSYFDSFGMAPPNVVPDDYTWNKHTYQKMHEVNCGQRCIEWLRDQSKI